MKIAYLVNQYPKPSHTFIRREIQALERIGVEIVRISIRGWNDDLVDQQDILERKKTKYLLKNVGALALAVLTVCITHPYGLVRAIVLAFRLALAGSERPLPIHLIYVAEACQLLLWLRDARVQHIHAHFGTNSAEVAMLTHILGGPSWSMTVHGPAEFDRRPLLNLSEKLKRCSFAVAISSFGRSQLYRSVEQDHWHKIHVIHCGLERDFYSLEKSGPPNNHRIICVGRLSEVKGQLLLLAAIKQLVKRGQKIEVVLAGDGEMRPQIEALIARYDLVDLVRITGWISSEEVRKEILAARALVLPSFAEGLPVVIMEAMALQRPVIATYIAGIPELVKPGEHGWLIPAGDVQALVEALQQLMDASQDLLLMMGQAGRARAVVRHDADKSADQLYQIFQTVIGCRAGESSPQRASGPPTQTISADH